MFYFLCYYYCCIKDPKKPKLFCALKQLFYYVYLFCLSGIWTESADSLSLIHHIWGFNWEDWKAGSDLRIVAKVIWMFVYSHSWWLILAVSWDFSICQIITCGLSMHRKAPMWPLKAQKLWGSQTSYTVHQSSMNISGLNFHLLLSLRSHTASFDHTLSK